MDDLKQLHEGSVLHNLHSRFSEDLIYTRTGPILIAMNPFKWLPLYTNKHISLYHGARYGTLPPHVFAEMEDAYQSMQRNAKSQSLVICGESGAGKTETTKLMLHYLSSVAGVRPNASQKKASRRSSVASADIGIIAERIMKSNPLMEAFGNAKTTRNNNSSRFGKFICVHFDDAARITGALIQNYLLEKGRATHQNPQERNFHIFYQLLFGGDRELLRRLNLDAPIESFSYLNQSGCVHVKGIEDVKDFQRTLKSMEIVGIGSEYVDDIMRILGAVLHLGNIVFEPTENEGSAVSSGSIGALKRASELMGVDPDELPYNKTYYCSWPRWCNRLSSGNGKSVRSPTRSRQDDV